MCPLPSIFCGLLVFGVVFPLQAEELKFALLVPLKPIQHPRDNPVTEAKIALGKKLFLDGRLSSNDQLFNTAQDPQAKHDLAERLENITFRMRGLLEQKEALGVEPQ